MDFDLIVFLLIFLFPLFQRLFGKKRPQPQKRPQRTPPELESSPSRQVEDPLSEALRQIREALAEEQPREKPLPADPPPVSARFETQGETFHDLGEFEHEAHGFGQENPFSEEVFEQSPAFEPRSSTPRIRQKALGEVDLATPLEVDTAEAAPGADFTRLLRSPKQAREAFVLKEIFGAPRSRGPIR